MLHLDKIPPSCLEVRNLFTEILSMITFIVIAVLNEVYQVHENVRFITHLDN